MSFTGTFQEIYGHEFHSKGNFKKIATVVARYETGKPTQSYIDLRLHYQSDKGLRATKKGVCLKIKEFEDILRVLMAKSNESFITEKRRISVKQNEKYSFLYDITLLTFEGKESTFSLSQTDAKNLNFNKDDLLMFAKKIN
jgi:hypothetical protein